MGKLTLRYFGPFVWEMVLPETYKDVTDLEKFKWDIEECIPDCKCSLCKVKTYSRKKLVSFWNRFYRDI